MDQEIVLASIDKHLDALDKLLFWALGIAVIAAWAGLQGVSEFEVMGLKTNRSNASAVVSGAFILANLAFLISLLRIRDLLSELRGSEISKGIEKIGTHSSLCNPFSYFGTARSSQLHSSLGLCLLIIAWWVCFTAIYTVKPSVFYFVAFAILFLGVGVASIFVIDGTRVAPGCYSIAHKQLHSIDPTYAAKLKTTYDCHCVAAKVSMSIGCLGFIAVAAITFLKN